MFYIYGSEVDIMKGQGKIKYWFTRNGVHVPVYEKYTTRKGVEPENPRAKFKKGTKKESFNTEESIKHSNKDNVEMVWDPFEGKMVERQKTNKDLVKSIKFDKDSIEYDGKVFEKMKSYSYKNGSLYTTSAAGVIKLHTKKAYRQAGDYALFVSSFTGSALPYSNYYIADKNKGDVYKAEVVHGVSDNRTYINNLVNELKRKLKKS